jgi:hypothetical protein
MIIPIPTGSANSTATIPRLAILKTPVQVMHPGKVKATMTLM